MRPYFTVLLSSVFAIFIIACAIPLPERASQPASTAAGEVAFDLAGLGGAAVIVPVEINGQGPFDFVFDTGATFTCVDQKFAEELKLPQQSGQIGVGVGIETQGQVKLVKINTLKIGTASASELSACVIDLRQAQSLGLDVKGLVGLNFLKSYLVTIDFKRRVIRLEKPSVN